MNQKVASAPDVHYLFLMRSTPLDAALSDPRSRPPGPTLQLGRQLGRWLGRLADIGVALVVLMGGIAAQRPAHGAAETVRVDLDLAWSLVARAMRWTRALRARLAAEAVAAKAAMDPDERLLDRPERLHDGSVWNENRTAHRAAPAGRPEPDDCIDGKPVAEVVGQICADLGAAATLLGDAEAARHIAAIAAAARALLVSPEGAGAAAIPGTPDRAPVEAEPAAMPAPAPDTG